MFYLWVLNIYSVLCRQNFFPLLMQDITLWIRLLILQVLFVIFGFLVHKKSVGIFSTIVAYIKVVTIVCAFILLIELFRQDINSIFFDNNILENSYFLGFSEFFLKCDFFWPYTGYRALYNFFWCICILNFEDTGGLLHILDTIFCVQSEKLSQLKKDLNVELGKLNDMANLYKKKMAPYNQLSPVHKRQWDKKFNFFNLVRVRWHSIYNQLRKQILAKAAKN